MPSVERTPHERETLFFHTREDADAFRERVEQRTDRRPAAKASHRREVIAQEISSEFEAHGEAAGTIHQPWEHTPDEHAEVQQLVDVVFSQDLKAALAKARQSRHYPRNLDLLHDVLTAEMYELMRSQGITKQPVGVSVLIALSVVSGVLVGALLLLYLAVQT